MQTADLAPFPAAAGGTRTITMGRNRLSSIENWVKPSRLRAAQTERASADRTAADQHLGDRAAPAHPAGPGQADGQGRAPGNTGLHRPVSQFVRTTAPAAAR